MANTFPRWTNTLPLKLLVALVFIGGGVGAAINYYFTPKYANVGYQPNQPIPFSHVTHAGQVGLDCRYCHSFVEQSGVANVPTSNTCYNCHQLVKTNSPHIAKIKESVESGKSLEWVKVHKTPDYAYFNHSIHVASGVGCVSCHGKVNEMPVVFQAESQSMDWCLTCHRNPEQFLRPMDKVTNLNWTADDAGKDQTEMGKKLKEAWNIHPPDNCAACHR